MKPVLAAFLLISVLGLKGYADCAYFRVSAIALECAAVDPKTVKADDPYPAPSDDLGLDEPENKAYIKVNCRCAFSLTGSDPRCDTDQTLERSAVMAVKDAPSSCRRSASLCRETCPARLP